MEKTIVTNKEEDTVRLAGDFSHDLRHNVIFLRGELGSGKTAFVRGLGGVLGIKRILSPTFTIIRSYQLSKPVLVGELEISAFHHVDLYRIANLEEVELLGLEEMMADRHSLVAVEWPEILTDKYLAPRTEIEFEVMTPTKRKITIRQ